MTEKELNQFSEKIDMAVKASAENVSPPPFYSVLQRIAQDNSTESYEEFFSQSEPLILPDWPERKKKRTAAKIIGIAAAVILCIGVGMTVGIILTGGYFTAKSNESDANSEFYQIYDEEYAQENGQSETYAEDAVSKSDASSHSSDVSSR